MPTPVIIDCDPGHDDVIAIWLAAAHPEIDLRAITTVAGNGRIEHTTYNARVACTVAGITGVPIAQGAAGPLAQDLEPAVWIHGENALGGPELPEPTVPLDDRTALELIRDVLIAADEPVTLIPTGPLTNIAQFVKAYPELLAKVGRVVWMGGSTERGNVSAYAEFNAWTDPEAVEIVLAAGFDFTMVGLNISHQALATQAVRDRIRAIGNRTGVFGADLLEYFSATHGQYQDMPDGPLHDPITVALVADPAVATLVRTRLDAEVVGTYTRGTVAADLLNISGRPHNASIADVLDVDRFWSLIETAIRALA